MQNIHSRTRQNYFAANPVAPAGIPATVCTLLKLPSSATLKTLMLLPPALSTYKNSELLLNAASIGPAGVVADMASRTFILLEKTFTLKVVRLLLPVLVV